MDKRIIQLNRTDAMFVRDLLLEKAQSFNAEGDEGMSCYCEDLAKEIWRKFETEEL